MLDLKSLVTRAQIVPGLLHELSPAAWHSWRQKMTGQLGDVLMGLFYSIFSR